MTMMKSASQRLIQRGVAQSAQCQRPVLRPCRRRSPCVLVRAQDESSFKPQEFGLAPAKPRTPYGEMLQYYLKMEPQLFKTAVEDQLAKLHDEKEAKEAAKRESDGSATASTDLVLYKRMEDLRANEVRATLEDLLYVSILEKFIILGIDMLPRMDGFVDVKPTNLRALTESVHSREALELVREHLMSIMGAAGTAAYSNAILKMSKFQMAQVYAASVMFGYFLRRVDQRFNLERQLGTLPMSREDAVARLEKLFNTATDLDSASHPEVVDPSVIEPGSASASTSASTTNSGTSSSSGSSTKSDSASGSSTSSSSGALMGREESPLRRYIKAFDQATMIETARIVSMEGAALVERQTSALLGDIKKLTQQIQETVGTDATSVDEVMMRMSKAVEQDKVETLTMTVGTQRRAVLEAVAFGTFLRDVETHVQTDYGLLTPLAPPKLPGWGGDNDLRGGAAV